MQLKALVFMAIPAPRRAVAFGDMNDNTAFEAVKALGLIGPAGGPCPIRTEA